MTITFSRYISVFLIAGAIFLNADAGRTQTQFEPTRPVQQNLIVAGVLFSDLVANKSAYSEQLAVLLPSAARAETWEQFAENYDRSRSSGEGIGGAFLDTAFDQLVGLDRQFLRALDDGRAEVLSYISGQIVGWTFVPGGVDPKGNERGSGQLVVETFLTMVPLPNSPRIPAPASVTTALRWTIDIKNNGYIVEKRATSFDEFKEQPFPQAAEDIANGGANIKLPWTMIARTNEREYDVKVWAVGEHDVQVSRLERALGWPQNTVFSVLPDSEYGSYYDPSPHNCVDLMLRTKGNAIPRLVGELTGHRNYCLGRCENPNVVNTP